MKTDTAKWGKPRTILEGMPNPKKEVKILKRLLSCGGTVKNMRIILQGNHVYELKEYLKKNQYNFVTH